MFSLFYKKPIHIFYAIDDNYKNYLLLAMKSVLKSSNRSDNVYFHILATRISSKIIFEKKVQILKQIKFCKIEIIYINDNFINDFPVKLHITTAAYLRYFIPILKPDLTKCLYLDVDTIVLKSLSKFYNINLKNKYAAVVKDKLSLNDKKIRLNQFNIKNYFNSGIMLLNLKKIRKDCLFERFLRETKYSKFMDQDVLNYVFNDNVIYLGDIYNYMIKNKDVQEINNNNITILHFAGTIKPWNKEKYKFPLEF